MKRGKAADRGEARKDRMVSGKLGLVLVLLVAVALAEEELERDVLTEDEEGVVEEDMSLYTRLLQQTLKHVFHPRYSSQAYLVFRRKVLIYGFIFFPGTAPSCTEC